MPGGAATMRLKEELEYRVLGPLEVLAEGRPLSLGTTKQRALLGILLLGANQVFSTERLVELLWGDDAPETAPNVLQVYISQLRKALEPNGAPFRVLVSRPPGYLLQVAPDELDATRFQGLLEKAAGAGPAEAGVILREALSLWRGTPLADFADAPFVRSEAARLNEMRLRALEDRIQVDLELGHHRVLVGELEGIVAEHPLRESFCGQLMLALYRSGRQAEASAIFQQTRERLVDELGMEPGHDLQKLLKQILNQDPGLELEPRGMRTRPSRRPDLPRGTLTFLMTDIEGSTKVWDALPALAKPALVRHDQIIQEHVAKNQGQIVESGREGDSVLAVFTQARDAVACACDVQRSLQHEGWPPGIKMRVRIAVHTGEAELRSSHYVGAPLYRCARMMAVAHGGQVLVSKATEELVVDGLTGGISLRDLGLHRLRDLSRPEHVYQLLHPDLEADFPALETLGQAHNLPAQLTSFVGRQRELEEIKLAIAANRLVTLTGPGGCGKTRLAIHAAAEVAHDYPDGVCFVDLSLIADESLVATGVAVALTLHEESGQTLATTITEHLAHRKMLLVVDNCEHVLDGCAVLVGQTLAAAPGLRVLATSQEPLNIPGEVRLAVPSLGLPADDQVADLGALRESEAGQLFAERAKFAKPGFALDERTGPPVIQICRRLDGIPLAIELAAAQIAVLTPRDIAARLDDRFRLLGTGKRIVAQRQRTLLAAVSWSHGLLSESQKILFRRLSVFSGGFDLEAAEAMAFDGSVEIVDVVGLLTGLVEKSLVTAGEDGTGRTRYRLLETLREFGRARLREAGEESIALATHLDHYLEVGRRAEPHLLGHADQSEWLTGLDQDLAEVRAALAWGFKADPMRAAELATLLGWYWWFRGYVAEGLDWMETVIAMPSMKPAIRGAALAFAGRMASRQGAHRLAASRFLAAASVFRELDNLSAVAFVLFDLGTVARATGRFVRSRILLDASLALWQRLGDDRMAVYALQELGVLAMVTGDAGRGEDLIHQAIEQMRASGERWGLALNLANLAELRIRRGDTTGARALLAESLEITERLVDPVVAAQLFDYIGMVAVDEGLAATGLSLFAAGHALREHQRIRSATTHRELVDRWRSRGEQTLAPTAADAAWRNGLELQFPAAVTMARLVASEPSSA